MKQFPVLSPVIDMVLELPLEEQRDYCIHLLRYLTCDDSGMMSHYRENFGLTPYEARLVHYMATSAPRTCSKEQFMSVMYDPDRSPEDPHLFSVMVSKLRRRGIKVDNEWGAGYRISVEEAERLLPPQPVETIRGNIEVMGKRGTPGTQHTDWSDEDVNTLRELALNSEWEMWAIADELGRTVNSVTQKLKSLFGTVRLSVIRRRTQPVPKLALSA